MLTSLLQIEPIISQYGLVAIFILVCLESVGLPLPGETVIVLAASIAGTGHLNVYSIAIVAFSAAVIGDNIGYLIGRRFGHPVIVRYGYRLGITHDRLSSAEALMRKRGWAIVIVARFIIFLRQLNGLVAGITEMHWITFLFANMIGAALWVGLWSVLAYKLGKSVTLLPAIWNHLGIVAAFVVPLVMVLSVYLHVRRRLEK